MPPPSQLVIATSSLQRLVKEEASYHKELAQQEKRLEKALASTEDDENKEYTLKQEVSRNMRPLSLIIPFFVGYGTGSYLQTLWSISLKVSTRIQHQELSIHVSCVFRLSFARAFFNDYKQRTAIEETKAVFPSLHQRIADGLAKLEDQLEAGQAAGATEEEVTKAKGVIEQAKEVGKAN